MNALLQFLFRYRALGVFVILELACAWLIVQNNRYQSAAFFNSANSIAGTLNQATNDVQAYLYLREDNAALAEENARLYEELTRLKMQLGIADTLAMLSDTSRHVDTALLQYDYLPARVINNSVNRPKNFLTLNRGRDSGIEPGMAVVGDNGVVGQVKSASDHYSVVISLLHTNLRTSGVIGQSGTFGSVQWDGVDPQKAKFEFVARHNVVNLGDTVYTSSYNSVFPQNIPIGVVDAVNLPESATYYDISLKLVTNFSSLPYVFVIRNFQLVERDSLEQANQIQIE
jgi:rod shape-determining protein MreC